MKVNVFSLILCVLCVTLLPLSLVSCIGDDRGECVQYDMSAKLVSRSGDTVPDTVARRSSAYLFINGMYERSIPAAADGRYHLGYNGCDAVSLVVFGDKDIHGFTLYPVTRGVSVSGTAVRIDSLLQPADTTLQSRLYYGNLDCSYISSEENDSVNVCMYDRLARLHVIISGDLTGFYGAGRFSVILGGLRNTLTYGGTVSGDTVSVALGLHRKQDGTFVSGTVATFQSSSPIRVTICRDGVPVSSTDEDSSSHPITVSEGDNKAIVITAGYGLFNIRVMPWDEYSSQNVCD